MDLELADFLSVHPFYPVSERFSEQSLWAEIKNQSVFGFESSMIIERFVKTARYQAHLHFLQFGFE